MFVQFHSIQKDIPVVLEWGIIEPVDVILVGEAR